MVRIVTFQSAASGVWYASLHDRNVAFGYGATTAEAIDDLLKRLEALGIYRRPDATESDK